MSILAGKNAVVVGSGQTVGSTIGIGRATAIQMAREGATVWCLDRDPQSAGETIEMIVKEGGAAKFVHADIGDENSIREAAAQCQQDSRRIDILFNNVGITARDAPVESIEVDAYDHIFAINLRGMALTCKHFLPQMRTLGTGVVINVSSVAALGLHANVAYKTTKAGVIALTQNIAIRYAEHGVRANCILPGTIDTPMAIESVTQQTGATREEVVLSRNARVPLRGRMGSAWDIAHAAAFIASDRASFISGAVLPIDGAMLAFVGR